MSKIINMKKILILAGHGGVSGVPRYVVNLYAILRLSYDVKVVSSVNRGGFDEVELTDYLQINGMASNDAIIYKVSAFINVYKYVRHYCPDIIWANSSFSVLYARILSLLLRKDIVVTYHGVPFGRGRKKIISIISFLVEWVMIRLSAEKTITISSKDMKAVRNLYHGADLVSIPNSVTLSEAAEMKMHCNEEYRFVMTTRDSYQKNIDYAVFITSKINKSTLTIFGVVSECRQSELLEVNRNVVFMGEVENASYMLKNFDCYLMTSRYEGFSLGMLEALSVGLCIVSTDVGGVEEVSYGNDFFFMLPDRDYLPGDGLYADIDEMINRYRDDIASLTSVRNIASKFSYDNWARNNLKLVESSLFQTLNGPEIGR